MKKTDKQTMDMLREELMKSSENAKVPLKLQKDSVVAMLKNSDKNEKDFSSKTGNKRNIVVLRRITAAAAVIAVVIIAAFYVNSGGVKVIKTDSFYKGYESKESNRTCKLTQKCNCSNDTVYAVTSNHYDAYNTKSNSTCNNHNLESV